MKALKAIGVVVLLALAAAGAWFYGSPGWTIERMQAAATAKDAALLSSYIDFPALRADLKRKLPDHLTARAREKNDGLGRLEAAIGGVLIGPIVDTIVTPEALRLAFAPGPATAVDDPTGAQVRPAGVRLGKDPVITRRGVSEFVVGPRGKAGGLVFRRSGLSWRLSGIDFPPDDIPATL